MDHFEYHDNRLFAEDVSVIEIAETWGTPCYIYSRATLERHWRAFDDALAFIPHMICYSVKANSNLAVLDVLARLGSGFDIVSQGELTRVLAAGGVAERVVFSGVGKTREEMRRALEAGVSCFNVESESELDALNEEAGLLAATAPVSLRVNPDVDAKTHPYIATGLKESKFGIPIDRALGLYQKAAALPHLQLLGVDCHIGSQQTTLGPFIDALERVLQLVDELHGAGIVLQHLNFGGGLGIRYDQETPPQPGEYAQAIKARLSGRELKLLVEPGRAIAGNAGILVTRVQHIKSNGVKKFAVVDAGMNDLLRPALYAAWQDIVPVWRRCGADAQSGADALGEFVFDVVGPVCESADFLGTDRALRVATGDLLAVRSAGAYGFVMSSNYNSRPRAAEVLVDKAQCHLVRQRESVAGLFALESRLP